VLAVCIAALVCAGGSAAARADSPTTQEITVTGSGGVQLACGLTLPVGSPPAGGWPGLLLFPGFFPHAFMEPLARATFAPAGFASLTCDQRGTGSSDGAADLAGPADVADAQALFDWLAARPDVSDTEIGAYGETLGGAEVWNAAVAGAPFKAIVPVDTWTSLAEAIDPHGVVKGIARGLLNDIGPPGWNTPAGLAARSSRAGLHSLSVPTLMVQSQRDLNFDLDQATAAYKLLAGPKRLYVGNFNDLGHPKYALPEVVAWFRQYLAGGPAVRGGVELEHTPWDGKTTSFGALPPTRHVVVNLPGTKRLTRKGSVARSVRPTGGPLETFGDGSVTVRYAGASKGWSELAAVVTFARNHTYVIEGAAPIAAPAGVVTIPLLDEVAVLPRGTRVVVTIYSGYRAGVFGDEGPPPPAKLTVERMTLDLSVLQRAVSR
jgi:hypothetical protein